MEKEQLYTSVENHAEELNDIAMKIWGYAETGMKEYKSSALQKEYLKAQGFTVRDVEGMDTAFVAEYGAGKPIIGILGEYDALPGLSQVAGKCEQEPCPGMEDGHGCGHNLLGTAGVGAAVAVKEMLAAEGKSGTIRYYGCPAEETLTGKPLMARTGVFNDLDVAFSWHPGLMNVVCQFDSLAMNSIKFRFKGVSAHAAVCPHLGRSALDAVELMNVGANYLREHIIEKARIHYCITNGGRVPNAVPDFAEVWYYIRAPKRSQVREITARLYRVAEGAAMMTETTVSHELLAGCYDALLNHEVNRVLYDNLAALKGPDFTAEDRKFAEEFVQHIPQATREDVMYGNFAPEFTLDGRALVDDVFPVDDEGKMMPGSFDAGDVSYITPYSFFWGTTFPVGAGEHSWEYTSCAGSHLGLAGMQYAAKALAGTAFDMLRDPAIIERAKAEHTKTTQGAPYVSPYDE